MDRKYVSAWEAQFLAFFKEQASDVRNRLIKEKKLSDDIEKDLSKAIETFSPQFKAPAVL